MLDIAVFPQQLGGASSPPFYSCSPLAACRSFVITIYKTLNISSRHNASVVQSKVVKKFRMLFTGFISIAARLTCPIQGSSRTPGRCWAISASCVTNKTLVPRWASSCNKSRTMLRIAGSRLLVASSSTSTDRPNCRARIKASLAAVRRSGWIRLR